MTQRTPVRIPEQEEKTTKNITSTPAHQPAHPSVKRVPSLVLGEQSTPTVSHCPLMVVVGRQSARTGSGRHGWYLLRAPCPGSRSAHSTGTSYLLSAQVPWLVQERVTCNRQREVFFLHVCARVCVCSYYSVCLSCSLQHVHGKGQELTDGAGHRSTRMYIQEGPVRIVEVHT